MSHWFTTSFQRALGRKLGGLLDDWYPDGHELAVGIEGVPFDGWSGIADIWIAPRTRGRVAERVLNIEIEHFSSYQQARRNIEHVVNWTGGHPQRRGCVLHLLNFGSNLTIPQFDQVLTFGRQSRSKQFDYDFSIYHIQDERASVKAAESVVDSYDFQCRVYQHLQFLRVA